jgi:hypothetical protein
MFGPLVLLTSVALIAQGSWELFARDQSLGAVLIAIGSLVGAVGATVASYVSEIERRRRRRGG